MSSPPLAMRTDDRPHDPHFHPDEHLFRRVPLWLWDDPAEELGVEAVELPDISVGRSKYGHAEWVRFDVVKGRHYEDWGVVCVRVGDIPPEMWRDGVFHYEFRTCHEPLEKDYPHAEIRAYENDDHIDLASRLPEEVHLKWRERLLRKTRAIIKPYQKVVVRQAAPASHKLEPHAVVS
jgi:hypothetical protein